MYSLLLLNGGVGARVGADKPKQLLKIRGIPLLVYSLVAVDEIDVIDQVVLNYPSGWKEEVESILSAYAIKKPVELVEAGETRHASVSKMLSHIINKNVIIHEAARPLVVKQDFELLISQEQENVSFMQPISFTVAPVNPQTKEVVGSLDRAQLRNVQLPQKFNKEQLLAAHLQAEKEAKEYTEDATLVASMGYSVHFIDGKDENLKVTTPVDMNIVSYLLRKEDGNE